ncbi:MAG: DUF2079 domain-containing protein [Deltaproteobacteria bacterium]|nr:DUF2079 domain-containing protein [Deltaproteobacteria bacterium]
MRKPERPQAVVLSLVGGAALLLFFQAMARWGSLHNQTFDLAFYARMAWGPVHGVFWDPIVGAHMLGLHVSLLVFPLSLVTLVPGVIVPLLLGLQAIATAAAAIPLGQIARRRFGPWGAVLGAAAWLLYPNIAHVATYEWHPGTIAVLPLAYALDALDRGAPRAFVVCALLTLACREDLGLVTGLLGLVALRSDPRLHRAGRVVALVSFAYVALFLFVLLPLLGPAEGSAQLHFGKWGPSLPSALVGMITHPVQLIEHLADPARLAYLPRLLAPVAFLAVLAPRWLIPVLPIVGINLVSDWPTTTDLDSHYQTVLLPFLIVAALDGGSHLAPRVSGGQVGALLSGALVLSHLIAGGSPVAMDYDAAMFQDDARSRAARRVLAVLPDDAAVQLPYALMPHVAERHSFGPPPPPDRNYDWVVLDAWHRIDFAQSEDLLRTDEEPTVRDWLARDDFGLVLVAEPYLVLRRGADPRALPVERYRAPTAAGPAQRLSACLDLVGTEIDEGALVLTLRAKAPCGADLALRLGRGYRPERVDLLFDGLLSPAHLRTGEDYRSTHNLDDDELAAFEEGRLRVGLLRSSGARPSHADPVAVHCR